MDIERELFSGLTLLSVERPGRYLGREKNIIVKSDEEIRYTVALAFPDTYEVGMSHVGLRILYGLLNAIPGVQAERVFLPWPDMGRKLRELGIPLFSLERKKPVSSFDLLGISLQHELSYTSVLYLLDLSGIPLRQSDRDERFPIILGGGPCTVNPEPLVPFFDAFFVGEAEEVLADIVRFLMDTKGQRRDQVLFELSRFPGIYVPSVSQQTPIRRQVVRDLEQAFFPRQTIVPYVDIVHDRIAIEIARGCTRGCRFCQAGMIYRPKRERPLEQVIEIALDLLATSGYEEISLLALSSTDYSCIEELVERLSRLLEPYRVNVSLPSLRMDTFSVNIARSLQRVRKSTLTFAPEAGTERLRNVINKGLRDEEILAAAESAFSSSWQDLKLYFMIGLPFEKEEDIHGIATTVREIIAVGKSFRKDAKVHLSIAAFVPKPHTPFQWAPQERKENLQAKMRLLGNLLRPLKSSVRYHWSSFEMSQVEALLARGDRRLSSVVERVYRKGGILESWQEHFLFERWKEALEEEGIDLAFYIYRERSFDEALPWGHISCGVNIDFLRGEYERARQGLLSPTCLPGRGCTRCGVCSGDKVSVSNTVS
ncbi:TIGR03960 family B12-binding radical SAM protein [Candidatus Caldatribacterium sp.]|uniref:TIGR03960 family B12-binding radical SAM protein n=1 Tax=Candidatus Caldatribacterium sp. TaxID=2282143 RepID=UPI0029918686|nr:TIGR03960 family B12-binding radical SAM protein [Candidatus Caldatribacterium sp.]MDW8080694.1 TIGR03960 family B12-binding radical SAM protein [Candidatus Calescibacterium sp.]